MPNFELYRDYPLAQIVDETFGDWIAPRLLKRVSFSEAVLLLRPSEKGRFEVVFPSSQVCLVRFCCEKAWPENGTIEQWVRSITKLWVFVAVEEVATLFRVVPRPLSFVFSPNGWFDLTIPMEPSLSSDEWNRLGLTYHSIVTINEGESRYISSDNDAEELCQYLRQMPSFCLQAVRRQGDMLDLSLDRHGALVNYLDIKRSVKKISLNNDSQDKRLIRMKIDALPNLDLEVEAYHLIPLERGLGLLRSFLSHGEPAEMVRWPLDD